MDGLEKNKDSKMDDIDADQLAASMYLKRGNIKLQALPDFLADGIEGLVMIGSHSFTSGSQDLLYMK